MTSRGREGSVSLVTIFGRKTSWRPPWTYDVLLCLLSYSKITKDVSALRLLNCKTSITCTRKESALNRSMVDYGNFFTLCWYLCFFHQLGIPTSLQFFGKKEKRIYCKQYCVTSSWYVLWTVYHLHNILIHTISKTLFPAIFMKALVK